MTLTTKQRLKARQRRKRQGRRSKGLTPISEAVREIVFRIGDSFGIPRAAIMMELERAEAEPPPEVKAWQDDWPPKADQFHGKIVEPNPVQITGTMIDK